MFAFMKMFNNETSLSPQSFVLAAKRVEEKIKANIISHRTMIDYYLKKNKNVFWLLLFICFLSVFLSIKIHLVL